jgi:hypothetical protein
MTKVVRTSPAGVLRICFADDGTLWALVKVQDESGYEVKKYDTLRHYDQNGVLLGTALSNEHFKHDLFPSAEGGLSASHDRLGVYITRLDMWIEVSFDGTVLGHWILPANNYRHREVFLSPSNNVYFSYQSSPIDKQGHVAIGIDRFDKAEGVLTPVDAAEVLAPGEERMRLFGFDGDDAIVSKQLVHPMLFWSRGL